MNYTAQVLMTLGVLYLIGMLTDFLGRRTALPRITFLLLFGVVLGPAGLDILQGLGERWFEVISHLALVVVGVLLGGRLTRETLTEYGKPVLVMSIAIAMTTAATVFACLVATGVSTPVALILAGVSTATAPAATADVAHEIRAEGPFTKTLLGIVAVDDAWGLVIFSVLLAAANIALGNGNLSAQVWAATWELSGAVLVAAIIGVPAAALAGKMESGEGLLAEMLAGICLLGGVALWLDVSFLLAAIVYGAILTNLVPVTKRPLSAVESIEWPIMVLFFIFSGASLHLDALEAVGLTALVYIVSRIMARFVGGEVGGRLCGMGSRDRRWMSLALMPHAGVALGMAIVAAQHFPALGRQIVTVTVAVTVVFELVGPPLTRLAIQRAGEAHQAGATEDGDD